MILGDGHITGDQRIDSRVAESAARRDVRVVQYNGSRIRTINEVARGFLGFLDSIRIERQRNGFSLTIRVRSKVINLCTGTVVYFKLGSGQRLVAVIRINLQDLNVGIRFIRYGNRRSIARGYFNV